MILKHSPILPRQNMTMPGARATEMQMLAGPEDGCPTFAMRKFTVAPGGCTPRHFHDYEHEIYILAGEGLAFGNNAENAVKAGDALFIPANEPHQFQNTGSTEFIFLCMVPAFVHRPGAPAATQVDCAL